MSSDPDIKQLIVEAILPNIPPMIWNTLLDDSNFRDRYGFEDGFVLTFDNPKISVQRSELYDTIREILSTKNESKITTTGGQEYVLRNEANVDELPAIILHTDKHKFSLPNFALLSPDASIRQQFLEKVISDFHIPVNTYEKWRSIAVERPFENDEVDAFNRDTYDTPEYVAQAICDDIVRGKGAVSSFVPPSQRYFERLAGAYDNSNSAKDYAIRVGRSFFEELYAWDPFKGFLRSLLLCSHSAITDEISVVFSRNRNFIQVLDYVEKHGDVVSQLGAIELGLSALPEQPEIEPIIIRLIQRIRDDDIGSQSSKFKLFSALIVLVDGELSRNRLMVRKPPFYRRLVSLTQAALIQRQLVNYGIDYGSFCKWALHGYSRHFYMQSLVDMRQEPRWDPEFSSPQQIKEDFFGRIMIAASKHQDSIRNSELYDLILGTSKNSIHSMSDFPRPYYPSPLEGAEDTFSSLPTNISNAIEEQLNTEKIEPSSFITLINSALIFCLNPSHIELAAEVLRMGNHRLENVTDQSEILSILNGLATVAATSRNIELAKELRILARRYTNDAQFRIPVQEAVRLCLISSASYEDYDEWRQFCGEWLTELAFGDLRDDDGGTLYLYLQILCHIDPGLWVSCSKADAALKAL